LRAAVLHESGQKASLTVDEVPLPDPGPEDVLIQVEACGLCGHDQADARGLTPMKLPLVLGHEVVGTVVAVGKAVDGFVIGDRVATRMFQTCGRCGVCASGLDLQCRSRAFLYGGLAEYVVCGGRAVVRVPDGLDPLSAAVAGCAVGTVLQALTRIARVRPGEVVAVTGATGGLGLHAIQVARSLGAVPVALTGSVEHAELLRTLGAAHVVDSRADSAHDELFEVTAGEGVDVVLDCVGVPDLFAKAFRALAHRGRYVFTGQVDRAKISLYPKFIFAKEAVITGSAGVMLPTVVEALDLVASGVVRAVTTEYPLDEVSRAMGDMDDRTVLGRAVVVP